MTGDNNKTWDSIPSLSLEMDNDYEDRLKSKEVRRHDRAHFNTIKNLLHQNYTSIPIRIATAAKGTFDGVIIDLSASGIRVSIPKELNEGERIKVGFIINKRTIMANGVARWTCNDGDKHTAGIEFHGIAADDREFIGSLSAATLLMKVGSIK
ncbi:MAG: PilZ domain-containing protein [Proteobacteria bacterium]|nr:PilZ domain-containing protein [Pseudomonadota bacterium]MBU1736680.1 PilZ domain-containing protein [Pseudomonadota bacterium]